MGRSIVLCLVVAFAACGGRTADLGTGVGITSSPPPASTTTTATSDWDGGLLAATPGEIRCGATTCASRTEQCCLAPDGDPVTNGCGSRAESKCNGTQLTRHCDETSDCGAGEVCCVSNVESPPVTLGSYCMAAASAASCGGAIACGSDDDCSALSLPACTAQVCRGDVMQTCGALPSEQCAP